MSDLIKLEAKEYGLEEKKAQQISIMFKPMLDKMVELEKEYNEIAKFEISEENCTKAKNLRLQYVKVRTGTAKIHKELKQFYLQGGRFVDGWKNAQLMASQGIEDKLKNIEEYYINIKKEKIIKLQEQRSEEIKQYTPLVNPELGNMPLEIWNHYIYGLKTQYDARIEAERKAEEERIELERKKALGQRRKSEMAPFYEYVDSDIYHNLDIIDESEYQKCKSDAIQKRNQYEAEQKAIREENERLKQEAQKREAEIQKEKLQIESKARDEAIAREREVAKERALLEHQAKLEREKRDKIEAELKFKEDKEIRLKAEAEELQQTNMAKNDSEKWIFLKNEIINVALKYSFESNNYIVAHNKIMNIIKSLEA